MRGADLLTPGAAWPAGGSTTGNDGPDHTRQVSPRLPGEWWRHLWSRRPRLEVLVHTSDVAEPGTGTLPRGQHDAPGAGRTDGSDLGAARGGDSGGGPGFDRQVARDGYAWWYVDALSDDGRHGLTLIAFIGSVFSPYYAWARRRGRGEPENFCSLNVALYGASGKRWALTERGRGALERTAETLSIGPSALHWDGSALTIDIDEVTAPVPRRLRGRVRLHPGALVKQPIALDVPGRHHWRPIAPSSRVEVAMERPSLRWTGGAYLDTNFGTEPLEDGFVRWDWSRTGLDDGAAILYDIERRAGGQKRLALRISPRGEVEAFDPPPKASLPTTSIWRIARATQADQGQSAEVVETLEDTPFYARSVIRSQLLGEPVKAFHESLSLDRFRQPWVQVLLPFRMPRLAR